MRIKGLIHVKRLEQWPAHCKHSMMNINHYSLGTKINVPEGGRDGVGETFESSQPERQSSSKAFSTRSKRKE